MKELDNARQRIEAQKEVDRLSAENEWQRIEPFRKALLKVEDDFCEKHMPKRVLDLFYETCAEIEQNENEELIVDQIFWYSPSNIWPDNPVYEKWWNDPKRPMHYREYHPDGNSYQNWTSGFKQELLNLWENGNLESAKIVGMTYRAHSKGMIEGAVRDFGYAKNYPSIFHVTIAPELNDEKSVVYKSIWCFGNNYTQDSISSGLSDSDISEVAEQIVQRISDRKYTSLALFLYETMAKDQISAGVQPVSNNEVELNILHRLEIDRRRIEEERLREEQIEKEHQRQVNDKKTKERVLNELRIRVDTDDNFRWPLNVPNDLRYRRSDTKQYERYSNNEEFQRDLNRIFPDTTDYRP